MEAGLEPKPDIQGWKHQLPAIFAHHSIAALLHILQIASKTGATLSGAYTTSSSCVPSKQLS